MAAVVLGLVTAACTGAGGSVPAGPNGSAGEVRLASFTSCEQALRDLQSAILPHVGPYGLGLGGIETAAGAAAGQQAPAVPDAAGRSSTAGPDQGGAKNGVPSYSGTNTHEAGIDEPDLVKTDGRRIVTVVGGILRVVDAGAGRLTGALLLPEPSHVDDLLLSGDHVLLINRGGVGISEPAPPTPDMPRPTGPPAPVTPGAGLLLVEISPAPKVLASYTIDGRFVDARMIGQTARVVTHSLPRLQFGHPARGADAEDSRERNRQIVSASSIDDWLPRYRLEQGGTVRSGRVDCGSVSRPASSSATSMLTVLTFDLSGSTLGSGDPVTIVADGDVVYGTASSLYVASDASRTAGLGGIAAPAPGSGNRTELYKFDISGGGKPRHVASGSVPGGLLNQYSMSEYAGYLRVATTSWSGTASPASESAVRVLAQHGGDLVVVGQVGGLGKGERIYAVRFAGPVGYVVTFRQTDPLYTLDLRDPQAPRVAGELKITGFSAYLHPLGQGRVVGIGQEATDRGRQLGTQVSLFDVSDPARPARIAQYHLPGGHSEVEFDPHAFLYWAPAKLLVLPVNLPAGADGGSASAVVLRVDDGQLAEVGRLRHAGSDGQEYGGIRRALVVGDTLWTASPAGLAGYDLAGLGERHWVPFA